MTTIKKKKVLGRTSVSGLRVLSSKPTNLHISEDENKKHDVIREAAELLREQTHLFRNADVSEPKAGPGQKLYLINEEGLYTVIVSKSLFSNSVFKIFDR